MARGSIARLVNQARRQVSARELLLVLLDHADLEIDARTGGGMLTVSCSASVLDALAVFDAYAEDLEDGADREKPEAMDAS